MSHLRQNAILTGSGIEMALMLSYATRINLNGEGKLDQTARMFRRLSKLSSIYAIKPFLILHNITAQCFFFFFFFLFFFFFFFFFFVHFLFYEYSTK